MYYIYIIYIIYNTYIYIVYYRLIFTTLSDTIPRHVRDENGKIGIRFPQIIASPTHSLHLKVFFHTFLHWYIYIISYILFRLYIIYII